MTGALWLVAFLIAQTQGAPLFAAASALAVPAQCPAEIRQQDIGDAIHSRDLTQIQRLVQKGYDLNSQVVFEVTEKYYIHDFNHLPLSYALSVLKDTQFAEQLVSLGADAMATCTAWGRAHIVPERLLPERALGEGDCEALGWLLAHAKLEERDPLPLIDEFYLRNIGRCINSAAYDELFDRVFLAHLAEIDGSGSGQLGSYSVSELGSGMTASMQMTAYQRLADMMSDFLAQFGRISPSSLLAQIDLANIDSTSLYEQFKQGRPVILPSGYDGHNVNIVFFRSYMVICDGIVGYFKSHRIDPSKVSAKSFKHLYALRDKSREAALPIRKKLIARIAHPDDDVVQIMRYVVYRRQITGNCVMHGENMGIAAIYALGKLLSQPVLSKPTEPICWRVVPDGHTYSGIALKYRSPTSPFAAQGKAYTGDIYSTRRDDIETTENRVGEYSYVLRPEQLDCIRRDGQNQLCINNTAQKTAFWLHLQVEDFRVLWKQFTVFSQLKKYLQKHTENKKHPTAPVDATLLQRVIDELSSSLLDRPDSKMQKLVEGIKGPLYNLIDQHRNTSFCPAATPA